MIVLENQEHQTNYWKNTKLNNQTILETSRKELLRENNSFVKIKKNKKCINTYCCYYFGYTEKNSK
jgi:hypothetical protein